MSIDTEWKDAWSWARDTWGSNADYSLEAFFRRQASAVAKAEGWEELGSSDVWHASYDAVKRARQDGVKDRPGLERYVRDWHGLGAY